MAKRRNGGESFSDTSLKSKSDVAQGNVQGRFDLNSLHTSFDDGASSCWESNNNGGSRGEGLVVIDGHEEWEDGREIWWVAKQESSQRDAEYFSLIGVPLFSCQGVDNN